MALSLTCHSISFCRFPRSPCIAVSASPLISLRSASWILKNGRTISIKASSIAERSSESIASPITLTDNALKHLNKMKSERNDEICLRIGVKQGGCSGMSYTMEFENRESARPDDSIIECNGFVIVCDPKSLPFSIRNAVGFQRCTYRWWLLI